MKRCPRPRLTWSSTITKTRIYDGSSEDSIKQGLHCTNIIWKFLLGPVLDCLLWVRKGLSSLSSWSTTVKPSLGVLLSSPNS